MLVKFSEQLAAGLTGALGEKVAPHEVLVDAPPAELEVDFDIEQAAGTGEFLPLARLTLRHVDPSRDDIGFDPVLHATPEVQLIPLWLSDFRRAAYRRSREGRGSAH